MVHDEKMLELVLSSSGINNGLKRTLKALKKKESEANTTEVVGWKSADEIRSLRGLEGKFLWTEAPFDVRIIAFTFHPSKGGYLGQYKILTNAYTPPGSAPLALERGTFYCCPNNPAIGWAAITLVPLQGINLRAFMVDGMMMGDGDCVEIIRLKKLGSHGPLTHAFSATHLSG